MTAIGTAFMILAASAIAADKSHPLVMEGPEYRATVAQGCLDSLETSRGKKLVVRGDDFCNFKVYGEGTNSIATHTERPSRLMEDGSEVSTHSGFDGLENANAESRVRVDAASGDLILDQSVSTDTRGIWGVSWSVGRIPLECSIIVPGHSGLRLTRKMPERRMLFDYPRRWEAQFVIIEGAGYGFYVWAEDTEGRFKRLVVERFSDGWELTFVTINEAPFDELTSCRSVPWHVNTYEGDWRVPARRYRDWAVKHFQPVPIEEQKPDWVRDTRAMVIMGMDLAQLDALAERLDPARTVLYVPSWRASGYDRDYPSYDKPLDGLKPFIDRAHALRFRVMLHVNYFGVDPKDPLYEQFEPYQVRDCFGNHERQWWLWTRAEPEIRFAYINPALKAWRDLFTKRMVELCKTYNVDALHLDQTLCIYNDHNGRIDGLSMVEGNLALHRQLREALPDVALSGEGLNEVTYRHEAFAQRHAFGVNHTDATWDRHRLALAHPISSYLFRPYTIINGYLGCAPPSRGQLYAAWNEAYEHWGVIPTLKPQGIDLADPKAFGRQFFDEALVWQRRRLEIDLEGEWPATIAFPFRTADGGKAARTMEGRLIVDGTTVSQTITGVSSVETKGTVPDWRAYDDTRVFGLDPERWYPCFPEARPQDAFHVSRMPEGMIARTVLALDNLAMIRTESCNSVVADLVELSETAMGGSRPFYGEGYECPAPFSGKDGARFERDAGDRLFAHPPWQAQQTNPDTGKSDSHGTGIAYLRYELDLPSEDRLAFLADVAMRTSSIGQPNSDGATFRVTLRSNGPQRKAEVHQATDEPAPLTLDLTEFAGQKIELELSVDPGPKRSPSFDWAVWTRPRIETGRMDRGSLSVCSETQWSTALDGTGTVAISAEGQELLLETSFPGTTFLLREKPEDVTVPCDLTAADRQVCFLHETGQQWAAPATANVRVSDSLVGGEACRGLFAHPPDGGQTVILMPMHLPPETAVFRTKVGIRDGSKSTGVAFIIEINGKPLAEERVTPGSWHDVELNLAPWAGQPVVLSLITDSVGSFYYDWALWGEPRLELK